MIKKIKQYSFYTGIGILSALAMLSLLLIIGYIFINGISHVNLEFLTQEPKNMGKEGGVLSVIVGTLYLTFFAVLIATPIGVAAAIFFTEYSAGKKWVSIIRFFTEILAGIPSIIFGLFGFSFFVVFLGLGWSILSGGLTLAIMILPTLIRATEESLKTVPMAYREGSLSLGASKLQTISKVIIPSCLPGILTGLILGIGRAIGETAAVILTCGSNLKMPTSLFDSTRTLSVHLYTLSSEGLSKDKTFATATLLIIIVLIINTAANAITSKYIIKS
ncbi:MAG: phosphate ABC transporter permease PstA [Eubacteriales bacterium]